MQDFSLYTDNTSYFTPKVASSVFATRKTTDEKLVVPPLVPHLSLFASVQI